MNTIVEYFTVTAIIAVLFLLYGIMSALDNIRDAIGKLRNGVKISTDIGSKLNIYVPPVKIEGPTAEWIHDHNNNRGDYHRICSNCGAKEPEEPHNKYCPKCKCKMISKHEYKKIF